MIEMIPLINSSKVQALSARVRQRWGAWGIFIFMLWAIILAILALANLLLLSASIEISSSNEAVRNRIWLIFAFNVCFGLGFSASVYGLWGRRNWGRLLFLWMLAFWSGLNMAALLMNENFTVSGAIASGVRHTGGLALSLWYLNLPRIKNFFEADISENLSTKE